MREIFMLSFLGAALCVGQASAALADEPIPYSRGNTLLVRYHCDSCHQAYTAVHGPSLRDIAAKYVSDPNAQGELETRVLNGSVGVWGTGSAMAPAEVPQPDLHTLIEWILSLR